MTDSTDATSCGGEHFSIGVDSSWCGYFSETVSDSVLSDDPDIERLWSFVVLDAFVDGFGTTACTSINVIGSCFGRGLKKSGDLGTAGSTLRVAGFTGTGRGGGMIEIVEVIVDCSNGAAL